MLIILLPDYVKPVAWRPSLVQVCFGAFNSSLTSCWLRTTGAF
ncbi:hypothetical protein ADICYQ_2569 [Cyclobacterium qasimii M12-11B]|uniref:Uncharacterized protein n=1 Tax=Cyclobacterium qasimii M12-11B TaxID=641524 RepID=S7WP27_9BACT|nr:hypothetical protein ADICYQ_2569 [Cyclobacterium qasimii M12-11B]